MRFKHLLIELEGTFEHEIPSVFFHVGPLKEKALDSVLVIQMSMMTSQMHWQHCYIWIWIKHLYLHENGVYIYIFLIVPKPILFVFSYFLLCFLTSGQHFCSYFNLCFSSVMLKGKYVLKCIINHSHWFYFSFRQILWQRGSWTSSLGRCLWRGWVWMRRSGVRSQASQNLVEFSF